MTLAQEQGKNNTKTCIIIKLSKTSNKKEHSTVQSMKEDMLVQKGRRNRMNAEFLLEAMKTRGQQSNNL